MDFFNYYSLEDLEYYVSSYRCDFSNIDFILKRQKEAIVRIMAFKLKNNLSDFSS